MPNAFIIGWGRAITGREQKSLQVFNEIIQYLSGLQQGGEIESFEPVALEPHGGDLDGFLLIRGDSDKLSRARNSDEFARLMVRAGLVVEGLGVVGGWVGDAVNQALGDFHQAAGDLIG